MTQKDIDAMRSFNRFYTGIIGLLDKHILNSSYSLPEVRVMYELYHNQGSTASDIIDLLHLDKGYLSRILKQFEGNGIITKTRSKNDGRSVHLFLTNEGKVAFEKLNQASNDQIADILASLSSEQTKILIGHMEAIKGILETARN